MGWVLFMANVGAGIVHNHAVMVRERTAEQHTIDDDRASTGRTDGVNMGKREYNDETAGGKTGEEYKKRVR